VRETGTYRRGLDGGLLLKQETTAAGPRRRERLAPGQGAPVGEAARCDALAALHALERLPAQLHQGNRQPTETAAPASLAAISQVPQGADSGPGSHPSVPDLEEAIRRLRLVVAMDEPALAADAARFLAACGPVGILPPDQYLALVVRLTEGCSWNACSFCRLYRDVPFRARTPDDVRRHLQSLGELFGEAITLRRSIFLGDANALCLPEGRLLPLVDSVAEAYPDRPLASFVDAWTGERKAHGEWQRLAARGLQRVYVGLESGDPELLAWLDKAGTPADAIALVRSLHEAGIAAGVIVLLGVGGERYSKAHVARTIESLTAMRLGPRDLLYFSEYVDDPSLGYGAKAAGSPDLAPLDAANSARQREAIVRGFRPAEPARPPRIASYDIREFVY
jgi:hypothetical protein